jgi:hypothetical protein
LPPNKVGRIAQYVREEAVRKIGKDWVFDAKGENCLKVQVCITSFKRFYSEIGLQKIFQNV